MSYVASQLVFILIKVDAIWVYIAFLYIGPVTVGEASLCLLSDSPADFAE